MAINRDNRAVRGVLYFPFSSAMGRTTRWHARSARDHRIASKFWHTLAILGPRGREFASHFRLVLRQIAPNNSRRFVMPRRVKDQHPTHLALLAFHVACARRDLRHSSHFFGARIAAPVIFACFRPRGDRVPTLPCREHRSAISSRLSRSLITARCHPPAHAVGSARPRPDRSTCADPHPCLGNGPPSRYRCPLRRGGLPSVP